MHEWPIRFRAYAEAHWGDLWRWRSVDPDAIRAAKLAFRAGFRAARRVMPAHEVEANETELSYRLRSHMFQLDAIAATPGRVASEATFLRMVVADIGAAVDSLGAE